MKQVKIIVMGTKNAGVRIMLTYDGTGDGPPWWGKDNVDDLRATVAGLQEGLEAIEGAK